MEDHNGLFPVVSILYTTHTFLPLVFFGKAMHFAVTQLPSHHKSTLEGKFLQMAKEDEAKLSNDLVQISKLTISIGQCEFCHMNRKNIAICI